MNGLCALAVRYSSVLSNNRWMKRTIASDTHSNGHLPIPHQSDWAILFDVVFIRIDMVIDFCSFLELFMIMTKACLVYLMRLFDFIAGDKLTAKMWFDFFLLANVQDRRRRRDEWGELSSMCSSDCACFLYDHFSSKPFLRAYSKEVMTCQAWCWRNFNCIRMSVKWGKTKWVGDASSKLNLMIIRDQPPLNYTFAYEILRAPFPFPVHTISIPLLCVFSWEAQ